MFRESTIFKANNKWKALPRNWQDLHYFDQPKETKFDVNLVHTKVYQPAKLAALNDDNKGAAAVLQNNTDEDGSNEVLAGSSNEVLLDLVQ